MVTRDKDFARFVDMLRQATQAIEGDYFKLPIAGDVPIYRERVYCYELYHRLRCRWPDARDFEYRLGGEVDKAGHKLMRDLGAHGIPDLLVHGPGYMDRNLVIVEVKPAKRVNENNLATDLHKLREFIVHAGYRLGVYLIYGGEKSDLDNVRRLARAWVAKDVARSLDDVALVWHASSGSAAEHQDWQ